MEVSQTLKVLLWCDAKITTDYRTFHKAQHADMERDRASAASSVPVWNAEHIIFFK